MDHTAAFPTFRGQWVHFVETTYGAWLRGDARGFRTRHHREHVEGDYKCPPPTGTHTKIRNRSLKLLKQPPVTLAKTWRPILGIALREKLVEKGSLVLCMAVARQHVHVLAKMPVGTDPRFVMGLAKKNATFEARRRGWSGELWAKRGKEVEVKSRAHQLRAYEYILAHRDQGAWVWDYMEERRK
jgi:hypothetical protein